MNAHIIEYSKFKAAQDDAQLKRTMLRLLEKYDIPNPVIHPKLIDVLRIFKDKK